MRYELITEASKNPQDLSQGSLRKATTLTVGASPSGGSGEIELFTSDHERTGQVAAPRQLNAKPKIPQIKPSIAHRIRLIFDQCIDSINRAIDEPNAILRSNAFAQLVDGLDSLWACRSAREQNFAEAINLLQATIVGRNRTDFDDKRLSALAQVVARLRDEQVFDDLVLDDATDELIKGGFDVFRELT